MPRYGSQSSLGGDKENVACAVVCIAVVCLILYGVVQLFIASRSCPDGHEKFIIQRDFFNIFTPEYTIYRNEAPLTNTESPEFPPAVRINTPTTSIEDIFFPNFNFGKPNYHEIYDAGGFMPLEFSRIGSLSSLFFPSYSVTQGGTEVAQIIYPITSEEADFWSITGLEKRYVVKFEGEVYISGEKLGQIFDGVLIKTLNFYNFNTGNENNPMAIIKVRQNALGRSGLYTVCIKDDMNPMLKELLFATAVDYDQHVIAKERQDSINNANNANDNKKND